MTGPFKYEHGTMSALDTEFGNHTQALTEQHAGINNTAQAIVDNSQGEWRDVFHAKHQHLAKSVEDLTGAVHAHRVGARRANENMHGADHQVKQSFLA